MTAMPDPNTLAPPPPPLLRLVEKPGGRGRAMITTRAIKPGEIILTDTPLMVYPSSLSILSTFCCRCFRELPSEQPLISCLSCHSAFFCSAKCLSLSHPKLLCHALPALLSNNGYYAGGNGHEEEDLLFLLSAYSLPSDKFLLLLSLHSNSRFLDESIDVLHSKIALLLPADTIPRNFSKENTSSLISLEKNKSFTLLRPVDPVHKLVLPKPRAYGVYLWASMLNHDCMPNACGFHYLDDIPIANDHKENNNTDVMFRALHEIEEGREVCISYVGVTGGYRRRQKRLMEDYGFECTCERCEIESQRDKGEEESEEEEEEETEDHEIELYSTEEEEEEEMSDRSDGSNSLIGDYIERYVCSCGGFLAPLPPSEDGAVSNLKECNGCRDVVSNSYLDDSGHEDI